MDKHVKCDYCGGTLPSLNLPNRCRCYDMKNKILLMKFTSRERPDTLLATVKEYLKLANNREDMFWLFTFDSNDPTCNNIEFIARLRCLMDSYNLRWSKQWIGSFDESSSKIHALNRDIDGVMYIPWDILLTVSDDQIAQVQGYDDIIRNAMPDSLDASLWFLDGRQRSINTQEILGRNYYKRFGYVYHPTYLSGFADQENTDVGLYLKRLIKFDRCIIKHHNPSENTETKFVVTHIQMDESYKQTRRDWDKDSNNQAQRKARNYDLPRIS